MDDRRLRYFIAVARTLSFTRAAAELKISQPHLTEHIQRLEQEVQAKLFERSTRTVKLTVAGEALLRDGCLVIAQLDQLPIMIRGTVAGERGRLILGFVAAAMYGALPKIITTFLASYPDVEVSFREMTMVQQFDALAKGGIHIGFVRQAPSSPIGALSARISREPLMLVTSKRHPLARRKRPIQLAELADESFVLMRRSFEPGLHNAIVSACEQAGFRMRITQQANQINTLIALVSEGFAIGFAAQSVISAYRHSVTALEIAQSSAIDVDLYAIWRPAETIPIVNRFVETVRESSWL